jgi:hypothetical protein
VSWINDLSAVAFWDNVAQKVFFPNLVRKLSEIIAKIQGT